MHLIDALSFFGDVQTSRKQSTDRGLLSDGGGSVVTHWDASWDDGLAHFEAENRIKWGLCAVGVRKAHYDDFA